MEAGAELQTAQSRAGALEGGERSSLNSQCPVLQAAPANSQPLGPPQPEARLPLHWHWFCASCSDAFVFPFVCAWVSVSVGNMCCVHIHTYMHTCIHTDEKSRKKEMAISFVLPHRFAFLWSGRECHLEDACSDSAELSSTNCVHREAGRGSHPTCNADS